MSFWFFLCLLIVVNSAIWVYFDASRLRDSRHTGIGPHGTPPQTWAAMTFLAWPIVFPYYLSKRPLSLDLEERSGPPPRFVTEGLTPFAMLVGLLGFAIFGGLLAIGELQRSIIGLVVAAAGIFGGRKTHMTQEQEKIELGSLAIEQIGFSAPSSGGADDDEEKAPANIDQYFASMGRGGSSNPATPAFGAGPPAPRQQSLRDSGAPPDLPPPGVPYSPSLGAPPGPVSPQPVSPQPGAPQQTAPQSTSPLASPQQAVPPPGAPTEGSSQPLLPPGVPYEPPPPGLPYQPPPAPAAQAPPVGDGQPGDPKATVALSPAALQHHLTGSNQSTKTVEHQVPRHQVPRHQIPGRQAPGPQAANLHASGHHVPESQGAGPTAGQPGPPAPISPGVFVPPDLVVPNPPRHAPAPAPIQRELPQPPAPARKPPQGGANTGGSYAFAAKESPASRLLKIAAGLLAAVGVAVLAWLAWNQWMPSADDATANAAIEDLGPEDQVFETEREPPSPPKLKNRREGGTLPPAAPEATNADSGTESTDVPEVTAEVIQPWTEEYLQWMSPLALVLDEIDFEGIAQTRCRDLQKNLRAAESNISECPDSEVEALLKLALPILHAGADACRGESEDRWASSLLEAKKLIHKAQVLLDERYRFSGISELELESAIGVQRSPSSISGRWLIEKGDQLSDSGSEDDDLETLLDQDGFEEGGFEEDGFEEDGEDFEEDFSDDLDDLGDDPPGDEGDGFGKP